MEFTSYDEALTHIHALPRLKRTNTRDELRAVLATLGHPERVGHYIHVTGTNGKGSTSNAIAHILAAAGCTVGLFTSPFIMRFNERIQLDNQPVSDELIRDAAGRVQTAIDQLRAENPDFYLKEFEFVTCMAFVIYADAKTDVNVIEVGIGGEHDSTNVITPEVSVITNVALDHMEILGDTIGKIAHEKSGIIKPGVPAVVGRLKPEALEQVQARCQETGSKLEVCGVDFAAKGTPDAKDFGEKLSYKDADGRLGGLFFPLLGDYQADNAAIAIRAAKLFAKRIIWQLNTGEIRRGLAAAKWPVRLERVSTEPTIILDGAHNPDGFSHVLAQVKRLHPDHLTIIAGILADKALTQMLGMLKKADADIILTTVPYNPRAASADDYREAGATDWPVLDWHEALAYAMHADAEGTILIMGSLYLVSAVRQELLADK
ncbi:bifunctional folylpolyglutamate synthase/dihydrofolate synthase [Lacticaseibacillus pabuli]|uniref:tetrahydrofolate synthase n=1 Tax=Lacticaseibacillus pabuli TaxID=3025672 RepID=A0ABY7WNC3_9LACO|nr:folylpolyglutamate synthase/dihydrofolate synthase family protein [Lacticaseibacillus sp. KACC 23028]WDF81690.1 bifunctional folylpolyglutamate synthase/dihydrofolate synthase [Lacticaseibacillus sp. KACC 23028]